MDFFAVKTKNDLFLILDFFSKFYDIFPNQFLTSFS